MCRTASSRSTKRARRKKNKRVFFHKYCIFSPPRLPWRGFLFIFAGMKPLGWIWITVVLAMAACNQPDDGRVETRHGTSLQFNVSPDLAAIDSLMWRQPDSALTRLLPCFDTCCNDARFCVSTATEYNRHYANLLLAELLYKNDYAQTNLPALLQAAKASKTRNPMVSICFMAQR